VATPFRGVLGVGIGVALTLQELATVFSDFWPKPSIQSWKITTTTAAADNNQNQRVDAGRASNT
jgi:hypothetical protein